MVVGAKIRPMATSAVLGASCGGRVSGILLSHGKGHLHDKGFVSDACSLSSQHELFASFRVSKTSPATYVVKGYVH